MTEHDRIIEQAAAWHVASSDDAIDWDGFTAWLEADPRHRTAYDEIALTDAVVLDHRDILADVADRHRPGGYLHPPRRIVRHGKPCTTVEGQPGIAVARHQPTARREGHLRAIGQGDRPAGIERCIGSRTIAQQRRNR